MSVDRENLAKGLNDLMVDIMKQNRQVRTRSVENAFRSVLRHRLLPDVTISQPVR